jgi:transposase
MFYIGLDIHTKHITICILDGNGKIVERSQVRQLDQLQQRLARIPAPFEVGFEARCGYGAFVELLSPLARRVVVAHPGHLKLIYHSRNKNDRNDALRLAKLLYVDELPQVHVPSADVRAWRQMILFRSTLIQKRTRAKNGLRALLRTVCVQAPRRSGLWTRRGLDWLQSLPFAQPLHALQRDMLVEELVSLSRQIARVERELARFSRDNPAVWQLRSIPGVGLRTAEAVVAFLDQPGRFARSKQIGAYFGLVPRQDQSGDVNRLGHITREGPATVRQLLTEAAWQAVRRSPTVRAYFERIHRGDKERRKIALTATAHYLARVMWAMLQNGTLWNEQRQAV